MRLWTLCFLLTAGTAPAATFTLNATNTGFYSQAGNLTNGNYATGWYISNSVGNEIRDFFVFDLTGVSGTITGITLRVSPAASASGYISLDPTETLTLFDVSTPVANLVNGTAGTAGFADLGTGTALGTFTAANPGNNALPPFYNIALSNAGIAYVQNSLGSNLIAFGGAVTTLAKGNANEAIFNSTNASLTRQLIITTDDTAATTVPEPESMILAAAGLGGFALLRRRRKP